jgi:Putative Flp pilus-assembly TadE/G-like
LKKYLLKLREVIEQGTMQFVLDQRGSTLPIYAGGLGVILAAGAAAITINQQNLTKATIQGAADSASLVATNIYADLKTKQSVNGLSSQQIEAKARAAAINAYNNNASGVGVGIQASDIEINVTNGKNGAANSVKARVSISSNVPILLGSLLGSVLNYNLSAQAESQRGIGAGTSVYTTDDVSKRRNLEIVLVLDVTGSMTVTLAGDSEPKIAGLRKAVKSLIEGIYGDKLGATDAPPANIKIGIIPFSSSVSVGRLLKPDELDIPADLEGWVQRTDAKGWGGCVTERPTTPNLVALDPIGEVTVRPDALDTRDAPQSILPEKWGIYYSPPVEMYQNKFNFYDTTYKNKILVKKGALIGFKTYDLNLFRPEEYSSQRLPLRLVRTGVSEYYHEDVAAPAASLARDSYGNSVPRNFGYEGRKLDPLSNPNWFCVSAALPLAAGYTKKILGNYVDNLIVGGATFTNIGMAWANRMISPWAPLTGASSYGDTKTDKVIILITDGYASSNTGKYEITNVLTDSVGNVNQYAILDKSVVPNPAGDVLYNDGINTTLVKDIQMQFPLFYSAYDQSVYHKLVGTRPDGKPYANWMGHVRAIEQRFLMACKVARTPEGYTGTEPATKVYTILFGFEVPAGGRNIYEECATKPEYAYAAANTPKLIDAFRKISDNTKLQLVK